VYLNSSTKKFCKGEAVFREGDMPDGFYIVKSGEFNVVLINFMKGYQNNQFE
jgi:CRP-like cAMP-binding protein